VLAHLLLQRLHAVATLVRAGLLRRGLQNPRTRGSASANATQQSTERRAKAEFRLQRTQLRTCPPSLTHTPTVVTGDCNRDSDRDRDRQPQCSRSHLLLLFSQQPGCLDGARSRQASTLLILGIHGVAVPTVTVLLRLRGAGWRGLLHRRCLARRSSG
jgi:hypothetical protein